MNRLRFLTAGESHGPALVGILEGLPAGLPLRVEEITFDLQRRQKGYGRGGRMRIENDVADILSGVRFGETLGSPVALLLPNKDFASWTTRMPAAPGGPDERPMLVPRPGHTDFAGALKYGHTQDLRNVLERASARETAMRVALGAIARKLLNEFGIEVGSYIERIGGAEGLKWSPAMGADAKAVSSLADSFSTRALDHASNERFVAEIDRAQAERNTVGGVFQVLVTGLPVGLGSHAHWDRRLDGQLAQAVMSIPAIKAVEVGDGLQAAAGFGSNAHDAFSLTPLAVERTSNHAGGIEGGISNGQPILIRAAMKPISTLSKPLPSVNLQTLEATPAHVERSDTCAVPAASIIAEAMVCLTLADALLETLGGDSLSSMRTPFAKMRLAHRHNWGHIYLSGPMGSGKTATARQLAQHLGLPLVDLDELLQQRTSRTIADIFEREGEAGFRATEWECLTSLQNQTPCVVALGGGSALSDAAWRFLRSTGVVVGLTASIEALNARLAKASPLTRPLLKGDNPRSALDKLLFERRHWYARADVQVATDQLSPHETALHVVALLNSISGPLSKR